MPELPIATGFYEDAHKPIAAQECTNWIPQIPKTNGYSSAQLVQTPGISEFATTGNFTARGEHEMGSIAYSVNGSTLYRINSDGTTTSLGTILGSSKVSIADNGAQMCIVVPGSTAYIYTVSGGLVTITNSNFVTTLGPSEQVVYKDGYFIHFNNSSAASTQSIFFISNLNSGTVYDALDFGTAEVDPDAITALHINRNQLYVGGRITIEPFANIGGEGFPFQRNPGAVIQKGIRAKHSVKDFDNSFVFVGGGENERAAVWRSTGSGTEKLSTAAIDNLIQELTDAELANVFATTYSENGAFVYYLHLNNRTFGYDAATQKWHERKSKNTYGQLINWRANGIVEAYGKMLVTDNQSGKIGEMSKDIYTEYGDSIQRIVSTQPFSADGIDLGFSNMEIVCESGTSGPTISDDIEPTIQRSYSDDGGYTFSNVTSRGLGKQGEYKRRQIWRREGQATKDRVYRFVVDEPIKMAIIKLNTDIEV